MAHDWGHVARQTIGNLFGGSSNGGPGLGIVAPTIPEGTWLGGGPNPIPSKITIDTATGKVTACRRRRRRRLLTPTDLNDLAALKTIVGGGQAMSFAVMKAVRR